MFVNMKKRAFDILQSFSHRYTVCHANHVVSSPPKYAKVGGEGGEEEGGGREEIEIEIQYKHKLIRCRRLILEGPNWI